MTVKSKSVYIRLPIRDIALIDIEAKRHGVTRSAIARHAIRTWLRAVKRRRTQGGTRPTGSKTRAQPRTASTMGAEMAEALRRVERASAEVEAEMAEVAGRIERAALEIGAEMDEALKHASSGSR